MFSRLKKLAAAGAVGSALLVSSISAQAGTIQLGFILDRSGSIGNADWTTIVNGLSSAIGLIPVGGADTYEVSVVTFSTSANANVSNFLVSSAAARSSLQTTIAGLAALGSSGVTDYTLAFQKMDQVLRNTSATASATYVNFATDGDANPIANNGVAVRNSMVQATAGGYVDNISIEAIGGSISAAGQTLLKDQICYPQPCDTTQPYNFPTQGFYIAVATAQQYADAIQNKIRTVTNQTPEPATLALVGLALAGAGMAKRRKAA